MTQDFFVDQDNQGFFDIAVDEDISDFKRAEGLDTAVDFQLFTDRRGSRQDVARPRDRQGWIGDLLTKDNGYESGSFLYLKQQARNTALDNRETALFAQNALEYFVTIGAAQDVSAEAVGTNIEGQIQISDDQVGRFVRLWRLSGAN